MECRWKGTLATDLVRVSSGRNTGVIGAPEGADILAPALARGWHEWDGKEWRLLEKAGVGSVATLAVQRQSHAAKPAAMQPPAKRLRMGDGHAPAAAAPNGAPGSEGLAPAAAPGANSKVMPKVPVFQKASTDP